MPILNPHTSGDMEPRSKLSILYLRCQIREVYLNIDAYRTFNSLFEMRQEVRDPGTSADTVPELSILYLRCKIS